MLAKKLSRLFCTLMLIFLVSCNSLDTETPEPCVYDICLGSDFRNILSIKPGLQVLSVTDTKGVNIITAKLSGDYIFRANQAAVDGRQEIDYLEISKTFHQSSNLNCENEFISMLLEYGVKFNQLGLIKAAQKNPTNHAIQLDQSKQYYQHTTNKTYKSIYSSQGQYIGNKNFEVNLLGTFSENNSNRCYVRFTLKKE